MAPTIYVVPTMDVEPTEETSHETASGPPDWEYSKRSVIAYHEILKKRKWPVTFFIHPEAAVAQAELFKDLEHEGSETGMHLHPWKYSIWRYEGEKYYDDLGGLTREEQHDILRETGDIFEQHMGFRPLWFRGGTTSANDNTFPVLTELGFKGGSCSTPGRVAPNKCAVWAGGILDPYRPHSSFRQCRGDLPFVEMPFSMDVSKLLTSPGGVEMYADLRPDTDWPGEYGIPYSTIAENIVDQLLKRDPDVYVINWPTHNKYRYWDPEDPVTLRMEASLDAITTACRNAGVELVGATLSEIVGKVMALPCEPRKVEIRGMIYDTKPSD